MYVTLRLRTTRIKTGKTKYRNKILKFDINSSKKKKKIYIRNKIEIKIKKKKKKNKKFFSKMFNIRNYFNVFYNLK